MVAAARVREHVARQPAEDLVERRGRVGRGLAQAGVHLLTRRRLHGRLLGQAREALDEEVDGAVAELAHRVGVDGERVLVVGR